MTDRLAPQQAETAASSAPGGASSLMKTLLRSEWPCMLYLAFAVLLVIFSLASPWFL
jgi:ribose transport system permease protein